MNSSVFSCWFALSDTIVWSLVGPVILIILVSTYNRADLVSAVVKS
jgi:hypothetical protein